MVTRIRGGHRDRAAASLGHAGALKHAGMEAGMSPGVFRQVVAPHKALVAQWTGEALLAGVCAEVSGQLVGPRELFTTVWPGTLEGPLT